MLPVSVSPCGFNMLCNQRKVSVYDKNPDFMHILGLDCISRCYFPS